MSTARVDPPSNSERIMEVAQTWGAANYAPLPVVLTRGEGVWVEDVEGRRYLDMLGGYSAMSFGHVHPELVAAASIQLQRLTLTSRAFYNDQLPYFCRELAELLGQDLVLPMNSGAEAVETAIKAARKWGYETKTVPEGRARIVAFANNFHGRTTTIVGMSTTPSAHEHYGPFAPGFDLVPFGDIEAVKEAIGPETVAVLVEPIQGEGGVVVPPRGFLAGLREMCDAEEVLLLCDEIQTGLGRTGKILDAHHEDVRADITIVGKALGGGLVPVSACAGRREVMGVFTPGTHGSTFGGNPLGAAVGRKAIEILARGELVRAAEETGAYFADALASLDSPLIAETRGRGLLQAIQLTEEVGDARKLAEALVAKGVLTKNARNDVLRFAPPLAIEREEIDFAIERIADVLEGFSG